MGDLKAFKAYDVRGKIPEELNEELVYKIGVAYVNEVRPEGKVVTGRDIRDSSPQLQEALNRGLMDVGADVVDAGLCGTETIYYASSQAGMGGGLMVTASHNPKGYNGIKPVGQGGAPLTGSQGLDALKQRILSDDLTTTSHKGSLSSRDFTDEMCDYFLTLVPPDSLPQATLVANPGNGCAGPTAKVLLSKLAMDVHWVHPEPDGDFPNGIPNPLLPENRDVTAQAVMQHRADLGIAWDGDFDRCFFFDDSGQFIEGYYLVGLLAEAALKRHAGATIIYDPRLYWNTQDVVSHLSGKAVMSRTGHAYIKESMRRENGIYGGEMSAHHYFRDFSYCDSGMLPWLMVLQVMKDRGLGLGELVGERMQQFPCSGEINFTVSDAQAVMQHIRDRYEPESDELCLLDGVSLSFNHTWRFNLRASNTEPLLRLNVESRGDAALMQEKTEELSCLIQAAN